MDKFLITGCCFWFWGLLFLLTYEFNKKSTTYDSKTINILITLIVLLFIFGFIFQLCYFMGSRSYQKI